MTALDIETGSLKSGGKCMNKALKWAIVGGLLGVGAVVATLVGLHVSGNLGNGEPPGSSLSEPLTGLTDSLQDVGDNLVDTGSKLVAGVKDSVADLGGRVADLAKTALGELQEVVPKTGELLHNVGQAVKDGMDTVGDYIKDGMDTVGDGIKDGMDTVGDGLKEVVDHAGDPVKNVMGKMGDGLKDTAGKAGEAAQDVMGNSEDVLKDVLGKAGEFIRETVQNVGDAVTNLDDEVAGNLDDDNLDDGLGDLSDGLVAVSEAVKEGVDTLKDSVSKFFDGGGGIDQLDQGQLASLMLTSVLGSSHTLSRQEQTLAVSSDGGNPYNGMVISRQPTARAAPLVGSFGSNTAPLELAMLTMEDGLAETLDGEMDLGLELR